MPNKKKPIVNEKILDDFEDLFEEDDDDFFFEDDEENEDED